MTQRHRRLHQAPVRPFAKTLSGFVVVVALGGWAALESGLVSPYIAPSRLDWRWAAFPVTAGVSRQFLLLGLLTLAAPLAVRMLHAKLSPPDTRGPRNGSPLLAPGVTLGCVWLLAVAASWLKEWRWSLAALASVLLAGRLCFCAMLWQACQMHQLTQGLTAALTRFFPRLLLLLVFLPLLFLSWLPPGATGDEPSYISYSHSLLHDQDLKFTQQEIVDLNTPMGLPAAFAPHIWSRGKFSAPAHYLGTSLVLLPVVGLGKLLGQILVTCRVFMLLLYGVTLALTALLARRTTGYKGPAIWAAVILGLSFPMLGMSYQIYPEPMVAPLLLVAMLAMTDWLRHATPLDTKRLLFVLAICVLLPWFHTKFAVLSAALALLGLWAARPWKARLLWLGAGLLALGALLFVSVHLPLYRSFLWNQARLFFNPKGMLGILTDSHNGLLAYAPWVIMLPLAVRMGRARRSKRQLRLAWAFALPTAALYVITANNDTWNEGGATALRYLMPVMPLAAPLLATVIATASPGQAFSLTMLCAVSLRAAWVFAAHPLSAYPPGLQRSRVILDELFAGFSWRELFPQFPYLNNGIPWPTTLLHATAVLALVALAAFLVSQRKRSLNWHCTLLCCVAGLLAVTARTLDSPNWTITASKLFERQCRQIARMEQLYPKGIRTLMRTESEQWKGRPKLTLALPAALKPLECSRRKLTQRNSLCFAAQDQGVLTEGPFLALPVGFYQFKLHGTARPLAKATTSTLEVHVNQVSYDRLWIPVRQLANPKADLCESSILPKGELLSGIFYVDDPQWLVSLSIDRHGPLEFTYYGLELSYVGLEGPAGK